MSAILLGALAKQAVFYGLALAVILAAIVNARRQGRKAAEMKAEWQNLTAYKATREAVDDESMDADPVSARERLRARNPRKP